MLVWSPRFSDHLQHVVRVWKLEDSTHKQLGSLFDTQDDNCVVAANPEICFCFWAFAPSTQAWLVLLKFVLAVFRPRVFMTSETRDSFREIVMVVPCDRLSEGRHHDQWEQWLQVFLEQFNVSGGAVVFVNCMSDQMIGAMERIHHGKQLKWNLTNNCNRDFGRLWMLLARERETQAMTRNITDLEYNMQTFVRMSRTGVSCWPSRSQLTLKCAKKRCTQLSSLSLCCVYNVWVLCMHRRSTSCSHSLA